MFPIYILKEGVKLPKKGTFYVVTGSGIFLHKDNDLLSAFVRVPQISFLEEVEPWARHGFPKIPAGVIALAVKFFKEVYRRHKTEAELLLHYSREKKSYKLSCPKQVTEEFGVDFKKDFRFPGFQLVGTLHSHGSLSAFHSEIDDDDDAGLDGLHIVLGDMDTPYFSMRCSLMVNANRFQLEPEDIFQGVEKVDWKKPLKKGEDGFGQVPFIFGERLSELIGHDEVVFETEAWSSEEKNEEKIQYYRLSSAEKKEFPGEWMDNVTAKRMIGSRTLNVLSGQNVHLVTLREKEEANGTVEHQGDRRGWNRLLSFALFGQIFTISVRPRRIRHDH